MLYCTVCTSILLLEYFEYVCVWDLFSSLSKAIHFENWLVQKRFLPCRDRICRMSPWYTVYCIMIYMYSKVCCVSSKQNELLYHYIDVHVELKFIFSFGRIYVWIFSVSVWRGSLWSILSIMVVPWDSSLHVYLYFSHRFLFIQDLSAILMTSPIDASTAQRQPLSNKSSPVCSEPLLALLLSK